MSSHPNLESESSLPTQPIHLPSSPPVFEQKDDSSQAEKMDNTKRMNSEPTATQHDDAAKPPMRRVSSEDTERPPSAQQFQRDNEEHTDENGDDDEEEEESEDDSDSDPAARITDFDWTDLHERYHNAMNGCHDEEGQLAQEWESLMNYFRIWAESGHNQETDRTFNRLKTRTTYVQNSEDKLEHKRNHYISVVKAFESALNLLKAQSYGR